MSKSLGPTFNVHTFSTVPYSPQDVFYASGSQNTQFAWSLSGPSTQLKTPATSTISNGVSQPPPVVLPHKRPLKLKKRTEEELEVTRQTAERFSARLAQDHIAVLQSDVDTPFVDHGDVVQRLLPYHIYQQPRDDLELLKGRKGKQKATDEDLKVHNEETHFALECYGRYDRLRNRFRKAKSRTASRASASDQSYVLAQAVLETDRLDASLLSNELKAARSELERLEREKRAATATAARTQYATPPAPTLSAMQTRYYPPPYPYAYTQVYGTVVPPPTTSTFQISPLPASTPNRANTAIPVQLPVASLPALHALGIHPVPATSVAEGQTPPPAVLRGSTANGTILTLEINVSLLQSAQMSGLAMVLNSLMSRSSTNAAGTGLGSPSTSTGPSHRTSATPAARNSPASPGSAGGTQ